MSSCSSPSSPSGCGSSQRFDWLLWGSASVVVIAYVGSLLSAEVRADTLLLTFADSVLLLINTIWWGLIIGAIMVGLLAKIPREFVISLFGRRGTGGIIKAAFAGVLLDLCSHGILMVGAKLYERGASIGQVIAFLIASPWNSFSLTILLIALIGIGWTLLFIGLSLVIGILTGLLFERLESKGLIPSNPCTVDIPSDFKWGSNFRMAVSDLRITPTWVGLILRDGIRDSRIVLRWVLFGVILASVFKSSIPAEHFETYFGPTWLGLWLTLVAATVMEICSEGSLPIGADLLTRAKAPGNGFMFLMAGVATDYTEVMILKNTTSSWKIALLLPAITVPQIVLLAWVMNQWTF